MCPLTKTRTPRSDEWATPQWLFDHFNAEFDFTLDAAAAKWNAKVPNYYDGEADALRNSWASHTVWLNPPYSVEKLRAFMQKAYEESSQGRATVVCLVPNAPDTYWWRDWVEGKASEIRPLTRSLLPTGRVHFEKEDGWSGRAGFASCLVIYRPPRPVVLPEAEMGFHMPYAGAVEIGRLHEETIRRYGSSGHQQ